VLLLELLYIQFISQSVITAADSKKGIPSILLFLFRVTFVLYDTFLAVLFCFVATASPESRIALIITVASTVPIPETEHFVVVEYNLKLIQDCLEHSWN
jgi:hypothetical protein